MKTKKLGVWQNYLISLNMPFPPFSISLLIQLNKVHFFFSKLAKKTCVQ